MPFFSDEYPDLGCYKFHQPAFQAWKTEWKEFNDVYWTQVLYENSKIITNSDKYLKMGGGRRVEILEVFTTIPNREANSWSINQNIVLAKTKRKLSVETMSSIMIVSSPS